MRHDWWAGMALATALAAAGSGAGAAAFGPDTLVRAKCGTCHAPAPDGRIPRVEDLRTTPEEWTVIVDRMRRLHGMALKEGEMDRLLKELATTQLLSPAEQAEVAYLSLWHNAQVQEAPSGPQEEKVYTTCVRCHSAGKIHSYRMTPDAWAKLRDFHLYASPTVVMTMREMRWIPEADAAFAYFAKKLPYGAARPAASPSLAGRWAVFGTGPGRGTYRGEAQIAEAGNGELAVSGSVTWTDGLSDSFRGEGTLYGGYALRTRTSTNGVATRGAFIASSDEITGEWHLPAPDFRTSRSQWIRIGSTPKVARIVPGYLVAGERTTLAIEGVALPDAKPSDLVFSGGAVRVLALKKTGPYTLEATVETGAAKLAQARVRLAGIDAGSVTLAPRIDHIAITPSTGRARMSGGTHYPAEGVQFEAIAYAKSGSGKGAEAVALGPVPATFRLAELKTRPGDDDTTWLGTISPNGTYLPTVDYAPNPKRTYKGENSGLVRVLARYTRGGTAYDASAELVVTVPDYIARLR